MKAKRITRKRIKGWRNPPNTVYVGRPTVWGNPFNTGAEYKAWLLNPERAERSKFAHRDKRDFILNNLRQLVGVNLSCWCEKGIDCHADVLLDLVKEKYGI